MHDFKNYLYFPLPTETQFKIILSLLSQNILAQYILVFLFWFSFFLYFSERERVCVCECKHKQGKGQKGEREGQADPTLRGKPSVGQDTETLRPQHHSC